MATRGGKHSDLTSMIINAFYQVYNGLGHGFLEKVYENALVYKLSMSGLHVRQQAPLQVYFEGVVVGDYFADLIVENRVVVELKAMDRLSEAHEAQLLNYLRATECEVGLLLNFGVKAEIKRKIMDNERKPHLQRRSIP